MLEIPEPLLRSIRSGTTVPFIGAGVSRAANPLIPSWQILIECLLENCRKDKALSPSIRRELDSLISAGDLEEAAERSRSLMLPSTYSSLLETAFGSNADTRDLRFHREILKIPTDIVVTTNYDRLLEHSFAIGLRRSPEVIRHDQAQIGLRRLRRPTTGKEGPLIVKLHGDIAVPESIVLTRSDYSRLLFDNPLTHRLLAALTTTRTLLFLGYSLRDRDLNQHLEGYKQLLKDSAEPHYALVSSNNASANQAKFREQFGVETIIYQSRGDGSGLLSALRQLTGYL
jgi:SIR2-like domain